MRNLPLLLIVLFTAGCSSVSQRTQLGPPQERVTSTARRGEVSFSIEVEQGRTLLRGATTVVATDQTVLETTWSNYRKDNTLGIPTTEDLGTTKEERRGPERQRYEVAAYASGKVVLQYSGTDQTILIRTDERGAFTLDISSHIRRAYEEAGNTVFEIVVTVGEYSRRESLTREQLYQHYTALK